MDVRKIESREQYNTDKGTNHGNDPVQKDSDEKRHYSSSDSIALGRGGNYRNVRNAKHFGPHPLSMGTLACIQA
jgi:hypothetical protein